MEKFNKMLYFDVMKGFLISAVIMGHSFIIVTPYLSSFIEKLSFSVFCKLLSPCVFCFFYFFGYGQGLKRKRGNTKRLMKRVSSVFFFVRHLGFSRLVVFSVAWFRFSRYR